MTRLRPRSSSSSSVFAISLLWIHLISPKRYLVLNSWIGDVDNSMHLLQVSMAPAGEAAEDRFLVSRIGTPSSPWRSRFLRAFLPRCERSWMFSKSMETLIYIYNVFKICARPGPDIWVVVQEFEMEGSFWRQSWTRGKSQGLATQMQIAGEHFRLDWTVVLIIVLECVNFRSFEQWNRTSR